MPLILKAKGPVCPVTGKRIQGVLTVQLTLYLDEQWTGAEGDATMIEIIVITGLPNVRWFGVERDYNVLVMDLIGPNLESLFNFSSRKISLKSVLMLADQMVNRVEFILAKSFYIEILIQIISTWGLEGVQRRVYSSVNTCRVVDAGKIMDAAEVAENKLFLLHPKLQPNWVAIVGRKNVGYNANTSPQCRKAR
ncbi:hypothetical protein C5167_046225 [Papaver somniferum]|uniref:Uncharacterized protein n=1 Tax=Papaver somniferum TaxID=3469 RepID=A0A4Y7LER3_PAPSO|nr:hypothetical protein C5167_046225 [Papaver somniferum]